MVINLSPNIDLTARIPPRLTSAGLFMALAVTLWTTIVIAYFFYSASDGVLDRNKPRFYNILEMITQSSFIYSLALAVDAILGVVPLKQSNVWTIARASYCMGIILSAIAVRQNVHHIILFVTLFLLGHCTYHHGSSSCPCIKYFL